MSAAPIAFVHHANQFVITDGYDDRDGISVTAAGYDAVLALHVELGVPASLHISGPALESIAWHRPALLSRLRGHLSSGLITLIGGTYGENIMPLSSPSHNRRQLRAFHELAEDLLEIPREQLRTAWVPERVWETSSVAAPLVDAAATGVRYRRVLLDDRLGHPLSDGQYPGSPRAAFDATGPYRWHADGFPSSIRGQLDTATLAPYRIADGEGLVAVPIASQLRYLIPPHDPQHLELLAELALDAAESASEPLLVFADDLERVAGVAGWERALERYAHGLRWVQRSGLLQPVDLDAWCDRLAPDDQIERPVERGTYYELAHQHGSGEDYRAWSDDPRWQPFAAVLDRTEAALQEAEDMPTDAGLCALAERLVMLGRHETAWQDPDTDGARAPAPWARATAAHAADALAVLAAARWVADATRRGLGVRLVDLDEDGRDELVVSSDRLFAVLSPHHGGRLTLLVRREVDAAGAPRGVVLVGNPADHWNFQTELHRHMQSPPNHPGALGVLGTEDHRHDVGQVEVTAERAMVELIDVEPGPDFGLTKRVLLTVDGDDLVVCVHRTGMPGELRTTVALSPDYPALLAQGRPALRSSQGSTWWAAHAPTTVAWVAHDPAEQTGQLLATSPTTGHALVGAVDGAGRHLHLVLGSGPVDDETGPARIAAAARHLHDGGAEALEPVGAAATSLGGERAC
ncbi:hypothetical protein [Agrococcus sp. Ld7]|uniref:hypothetical protein n=1 Tax=Agrococcus sp. Ld7 TaxID=649148 RepID=UPI00386CAB30